MFLRSLENERGLTFSWNLMGNIRRTFISLFWTESGWFVYCLSPKCHWFIFSLTSFSHRPSAHCNILFTTISRCFQGFYMCSKELVLLGTLLAFSVSWAFCSFLWASFGPALVHWAPYRQLCPSVHTSCWNRGAVSALTVMLQSSEGPHGTRTRLVLCRSGENTQAPHWISPSSVEDLNHAACVPAENRAFHFCQYLFFP